MQLYVILIFGTEIQRPYPKKPMFAHTTQESTDENI